jgi:hypothetical protein
MQMWAMSQAQLCSRLDFLIKILLAQIIEPTKTQVLQGK